MKALIALVAAIGFAATSFAENKFELGGEYRMRVNNNVTPTGIDNGDNGTNNDWKQRIKLGLNFNPGEKLSATVSLLHNTTFGSEQFQGTKDSSEGRQNGVGDGQNMLLVHEAFASWAVTDATLLRLGRGTTTLSDGRVVSSNDWDETPTTFEGIVASHDMEIGLLNAFYIKFADFTTAESAGVNDAERQAFGFSFDLKAAPDFLSMVNFHAIQTRADETTNAFNGTTITNPVNSYGINTLRLGTAIAGDTIGFDYRATFSLVSGEVICKLQALCTTYPGVQTGNLDVNMNMIDLEAGYTLADLMNTRIYVLYHSDSGQKDSDSTSGKFNQYSSYHYDSHANGGLMDIFKWGNLTYLQAGITLEPMDDLNVGAHFTTFSQTEKGGITEVLANGSSFAVSGTDAAQANETALGSEIDLVVTKKYDNGLDLTGRYGIFKPGDIYKSASRTDSFQQFFVEALFTF